MKNASLNLKENDPKILTQYGITLCRLNRIDEAIHVFIRSIGIDPGYSLAVWHLAIAYKATGLYEEAIVAYEKAKRLCVSAVFPNWARVTGAFAYQMTGQTTKARL